MRRGLRGNDQRSGESAFVSAGRHALKGVAEPVELFALSEG